MQQEVGSASSDTNTFLSSNRTAQPSICVVRSRVFPPHPPLDTHPKSVWKDLLWSGAPEVRKREDERKRDERGSGWIHHLLLPWYRKIPALLLKWHQEGPWHISISWQVLIRSHMCWAVCWELREEKTTVLPLPSRFFHLTGKKGKSPIVQLKKKETLMTANVVGIREKLGCVSGNSKASWRS